MNSKYSLYFICENGNILTSTVLATKCRTQPQKIVEVVKVRSKAGLDKLKSRGTIYRGPMKWG